MAPSLLLITVLLAAGESKPLPSDVVARAGSFVLSREMLDAYWESLPAGKRAALEADGGKRALVEEMIDTKLVIAEAERTGLAATPRIRAQAEMASDTVIYRAFLEQEISRKIVNEEVMRSWYEEHKDRFKVEQMIRARQIVITPFVDKRKYNETGEDATSEAEAELKAKRLAAELKAGADFATIARKYSEDPSAPKGGLLEDFPRGRMSKPIEDAAFSLEAGKTSDVIRSPYGFHVIRVEAVLPEHIAPFAEVQDSVARAVAEERKDSFSPRWQALRERLRAATRIEIDERALPATPRRESTAPAPPSEERRK